MRFVSFCFAATLSLSPLMPLSASAQGNEQTLADIRQELSVLYVEIQKLNRELSTTGAPSRPAGSASVLQRVDLIEEQLQRLTAKTEELEYHINQIVSDGTNRIGDLEFRLCELETNCDIGTLGQTGTLGGGAAPQAPVVVPETNSGGAELAMGEKADFDRARAALDAGEFASAVDQFQTFTNTYQGGPLTGPAHFWRGEALTAQNEIAPAARAYLESFSTAPGSDVAPQALLRLGQSLNTLGQTNEACVTLGEVQVRFPDSDAAFEAGSSRRAIGCP